jgi:hypothetical protein
MEEPGLHDPFPGDFPWEKLKTRIALPQHCPLAVSFIDQNIRRLALAAGLDDPMGLDSCCIHFILLKSAEGIVADLSDISRLQPPTCAGHDRACDLPPGEDFGDAEFNLGVKGRELRKANDCIGRVESDANEIDRRNVVSHEDTLRKIWTDAREMKQRSVR